MSTGQRIIGRGARIGDAQSLVNLQRLLVDMVGIGATSTSPLKPCLLYIMVVMKRTGLA